MIKVFIIHVEPEGDLFFTPEGVLVTIDHHSYKVYSLDSRHNFLRAAMTKFPLEQLQGEGIHYRDAYIKIEPFATLDVHVDRAPALIVATLEKVYESNPTRFFFLEKHLMA